MPKYVDCSIEVAFAMSEAFVGTEKTHYPSRLRKIQLLTTIIFTYLHNLRLLPYREVWHS